jgi:chromosome partitioning protein
LVDLDPQGSARDLAAVRDDQPVPVVGIDRPTIDRDLKNVTKKEFVVIDGAPQAADLAVSAIKAADFILIRFSQARMTFGQRPIWLTW